MNFFKKYFNKILLVFFLIISLLPIIPGGTYSYRVKPKFVVSCMDITSILSALQLFKAENYSYPTSAEGLIALVENPDNKYPNWRQFLPKMPIDPWGVPYHYIVTKNGLEVFSYGFDGDRGGEGVNKDVFYPECEEPIRRPSESLLKKLITPTIMG